MSYVVPQLVAPSLGALSQGGVTIDYYAAKSELRWTNNDLRNLHADLQGADFAWRKGLNSINLDALRLALAGQPGVNEIVEGVHAMRNWPLPFAAPIAVLLEASVGNRPVNSSTRGALLLMRDYTLTFAGAATAVTGVCLALTAASAFIPPLVEFVPVFAAIAGVAGGSAVIAAGLAVVLDSVANGQKPDRAKFEAAMRASAKMSGRTITQAQIDAAYAAACNGATNFNAYLGPQATTAKASSPPRTIGPTVKAPVLTAAQLSDIQRKANEVVAARIASGELRPLSSTSSNGPLFFGIAALAGIIIWRRRR